MLTSPAPTVPTVPGAPTTVATVSATVATHVLDRRRVARDRVGAAILLVCALGAAASVVLAIPAATSPDPATQGVETWRMIGYGTFAGIFALLARAPRQLRGLWELTILSKLALPAAGLTFAAGADEAHTLVVVDGILVGLVIAAYLLMSGWRATRPGAGSDAAR